MKCLTVEKNGEFRSSSRLIAGPSWGRGLLCVLALVVPCATGCDKVPTFQELTGQEEKKPTPSTPPAKAAPAQAKKTPTTSTPVEPTPTKPSPEAVLARFRELSPNAIQDEDLAQLAELTEGLETITSLDLTASAVTDEGLSSIGDFPNVNELVLDAVKFTPAGFQTVARLKTLEKLSLKGAPHEDAGVSNFDAGLAHLGGMQQLKELDLSRVRLTDAGLAPIGTLVNLETLILNDTAVTNVGLAHLQGLTNLKLLKLNRTGISDEGYVYFKGLTALEALQVSDTATNGSGFTNLRRGRTSGLKHISVVNTRFGDYGFAAINGWKTLEELYVGNAGVTDSSLDKIVGLSNLQVLDLRKNSGLTNRGIIELKGLRHLRILDLRDLPRVSDPAFDAFLNYKELEELWLEGTNCTTRNATKLKALLQKKKYSPNLKITVGGQTI